MELEPLTKFDQVDLIVGFFDLKEYARWSEKNSPKDLLELATELFNRTGSMISESGGILIKAIGDGGMFAFPSDNPDDVISELQKIRLSCNAWLSEIGYPGTMFLKVQFGPVAVGHVGSPDNERLDLYGATVNRAAMMQGRDFAVGTTLVELLNSNSESNLTRLDEDEFVLTL
jgi:adenylate cyclase